MSFLLKCVLPSLLLARLFAADLHGIVKFAGLPVPGATVTAVHAASSHQAVTDAQGACTLHELAPGSWMLTVAMTGFEPVQKEIVARDGMPAFEWELKMLPLEAIHAQVQGQRTELASSHPAPAAPPTADQGAISNIDAMELNQRAADGFLINGTTNNGAASPFGQSAAFGNNRRGNGALYDFGLGVILGNSALDAKPYSLTGQDTPKADYNRIQGLLSFGGPLKIPHLLKSNGPNLTINYQWVRSRTVATQSGLVPTSAERNGELSPSLIVPSSSISPQSIALLKLYPLPNFSASSRYNYQAAITGETHQDNLQSRFNQRLTRTNRLSGNFAFSSTRTDSPTLLGFLDKSNIGGMNSGVDWLHVFSQRLYTVLGVQFSRSTARVTPFFANRENVSGNAGITGNNQDPANWGPPSLSFASGIAALGDVQSSLTRDQTTGVSLEAGWNRGRHNMAFGGLYRRQQFNLLGQEDPRGTLAFTGQATGSDLADFLLGVPDTSSIAFGNADKYLRSSTSALYAADDWRINPGLTLNLGLRWEYTSPVTELNGRLVNLAIAPGFRAAVPVTGSNSVLIEPDRNNFAPRGAFAWRPFSASSTVIRGGYGIYHDTSVYLAIAARMAQQSPLSKSLRAQNSAATPLTLANAFSESTAITQNTFAVDPNFRIGYAQNWQLSIQRDLPGSLVFTGTYLGSKGTRAEQQFLPNTYPDGAVNPCPACPIGFAYLASNGNSIRHAAQLEVRRRLRSGITSTVQYTFAKSIDDASLGGKNQGGALIAQDWLNLRAERALSNFDQRHLLSVLTQYTTGMGLHGGTLAGGWRGSLFKDWTVSSQISAGSGLPLTPVYFAAVAGSGVTGSIRPDYTGADLYTAPPGLALNPAAYTAPALGRWGNAGRNSITGPSQFTLDGSLSRTFRISDRVTLDLRIDAVNALNHPVFPSWNTLATSSQFGLPNPANPMRSVQTVARFRF